MRLVEKIILIVLPSLFLLALVCPLLSATVNMSSSETEKENLFIFDFFKSDYFNYLRSVNTTIPEKVAAGTFLQFLIPGITVYLGIVGVLVTSILSIVFNALALKKPDRAPAYKCGLASGICYFAMVFGIVVSMIGFVKVEGEAQSSLSFMPILMIVLSLLIGIALFVLRICFGKMKKEVKPILTTCFRGMSFLMSFIVLFAFTLISLKPFTDRNNFGISAGFIVALVFTLVGYALDLTAFTIRDH